CLQYSFSPYSF
nr:immunoglobulin light chain junction region [Macaca mulatta]